MNQAIWLRDTSNVRVPFFIQVNMAIQIERLSR